MIHGLKAVSQNCHAAGKQFGQDQVLHVRIVLHLVNYQMLDPLMSALSQKTVL